MRTYIGLVFIFGSVFLSGMKVADKTNLTKKLIEAAHKGSKEECETLVALGADVNSYDNCRTIDTYGNNALSVAAEKGHKEVCAYLISKGADVHAEDENGFTALLFTAMGHHMEVCKLLLINTLLLDCSTVSTKDAKERLFTALLVFGQEKEWGKLPHDIQLVIISGLIDDLSILAAGRCWNMDGFPPILQKAIAHAIPSIVLSEKSKKLFEEARENWELRNDIRALFTADEILKIFPGELGILVRKKMMNSNSIS